MLENIEKAGKSSKSKKTGYYILGIFFIVAFFVFLLIHVGHRIDKSLEGSNKPILEEINKISGNMEEIKSGVEDGDIRMDSLDEMVTTNKSEVQLLRDSLYILNKEIKSLNFKVNSLVQWQTDQKQINEYWGGKTLELLNWKIDIADKEKAELKKIENKAVAQDSIFIKEEADSVKVERKKARKGDYSLKIKDDRNY